MHERQLTCMTLKKTATSISAQSSTMWRKRPVQPVLCAILIVPVKELVQEIDHYLSFSGHSRRGSGIGVYVHCFLGDSYWKHLHVYNIHIYIYTNIYSIYIFVTHIPPIPLISNMTQECAEVTCSSLQRRGASNDDVPGAGPC